MHYTSPANPQKKEQEHQIHYLVELQVYKNYKEQIHPMHYTSPAHPQEKKQEYQIDYLQRLVQNVLIVGDGGKMAMKTMATAKTMATTMGGTRAREPSVPKQAHSCLSFS